METSDLKVRKIEIAYINKIIENYPIKILAEDRRKSFLLGINSLRFHPHWKPISPDQIVGLIEMINYINSIDSTPKKMIEIGTFLGEAASIFLSFKEIEKIYCVDIDSQGNEIKSLREEKLESFIKEGRCVLIKEDSKKYLKNIEKNSIDLIYIDGDHTFWGVVSDLRDSIKILKKNGFLCGHDFIYHNNDVKNAIFYVLSENNISSNKLKIFRDGSWCIQI